MPFSPLGVLFEVAWGFLLGVSSKARKERKMGLVRA